VRLTRIRLGFLIFALAVNLLLAGTSNLRNAHACSCAGAPLEDHLRTSDAVFSGEVVDIDESDLSRGPWPRLGKVTFDVSEVWKGVSEEPVAVYGQGPEATCGIDFEEGESYLVYAYRSSGGGALQTDLCNETKPLAAAERDLQLLGPPDATLPGTGGYIFSPVGDATAIAAAFALLALAGTLVVWRLKRDERT
jgi:Tissue inhibitor of metalloproteinase